MGGKKALLFLFFQWLDVRKMQKRILEQCLYNKKMYLCRRKSIGEQSVSDVHNLAMTLRRANLSISFFISVLQ